MFPLIARYLPPDIQGGPQMEAVFLTASLYAYHRKHDSVKVKSLGDSLRRAVEDKHGEQGVEARLAAALDAHPDDLPRHLQGLVTTCESAGAAINWYAFYDDVRRLLGNHEESRNRVRLRWAREFWGGSSTESEPAEQEDPKS